MRGRSRTKGPNPLTRSYESNGPDVKIRGTAQHVADKYAQLARDATASGDPVAAENYFQHAEHYYRLIATAQEQFRQQYGTQQRPFDEDGEDGDEEGGAPNGYGHPGERMQMDEFGEGPGGGQPYEMRGGNGDRPQNRYDRNDRGPDRGDRGQDRGNDRGPDRGNDRGPDRNADRGPDRGPGGGDRNFDRGGDRNAERPRFDRGGNGERFDRNGERPDRNQDRNGGRAPGGERYDRFERNGAPQGHAPQGQPQHGQPPQGQAPQGQAPNGGYERQDREGGNRRERFAGGDGRRDFNRDNRPGQPRPDARPPQVDESREPVATGLPAFLTTPVRAPIALPEEPAPQAFAPANEGYDARPDGDGIPGGVAAEPRPRRARRPRRADPAATLDLGAPGEREDEAPID